MFAQGKFKSALLQSSGWTGVLPGLGSTLAIGLLAAAPPARAANECGAPGGPPLTVVCDASGNDYTDGITYDAPDGGTLEVRTGVVVDRTAPGLSLAYGVQLFSTDLSADPAASLNIRIDPGVTINVSGDSVFGVQGHANVNSMANINIDFAGIINYSYNGTITPGNAAAGVIGRISTPVSAASISVTQRVESTITANGEESVGLYALHRGIGGTAAVTAFGTINLTGDQSYGLMAFAENTNGATDVRIVQNAGSSITTSGTFSVGAYALVSGDGAADVEIAGSIETLGEYSDGVFAYIENPTSTANASVVVADTARITTHGSSYGVWAFHAGLGAATTTSAGVIETFGAGAGGIQISGTSADNDQHHAVSLTGNASIVTHGDSSSGIALQYEGKGTVAVDLADASAIATGGSSSHGIHVSIPGSGTSTVTQGASSTITVTGASSYGVLTETQAASVIGIAGMVQASGASAGGVAARSAAGAATIIQSAGSTITAGGASSYGVLAESQADALVGIGGSVQAGGASSFGVSATSAAGAATVTLAGGAIVTGGWEDGTTAPAVPAAGVRIGAATAGLVNNAGTISAGSDRAVVDANRGGGAGGALSVQNTGTITGFLEYAAVAGNRFTNAAGGVLDLRHFADTDGDGVRDTKRVSVSDFGGPNAVFDNAGTVRLAPVATAATTSAAGYYVPTTGVDSRALEASFYDLNRAGVVQAQLVNLATFNHSGVIDLRGSAIGNTLVITGGAGGPAEFVSNGGKLYVSAVLNQGLEPDGISNSHADMLIVDSTRLGTAPTAIHVDYDPDSVGSATPGNGIQLVEVRNKAASAARVFVLENRIVAGAYEYLLHHNGVGGDAADGNWYLRSTISAAPQEPADPSPVAPVDPAPIDPAPIDPTPSDSADPVPSEPAPPSPSDPDTGGTPQPVPDPVPEYPAYRPEIPTYVALPALAHRFGMEMLGNYHDRVGQDYIHLPVGNPALAEAQGRQRNLRRETSMWGRVFGFHGEFGDSSGDVATRYGKFSKRGASYNRHSYGLQLGLDLHRVTGPGGSRLAAGLYAGFGRISGTVDAVYGGRSGKAKLNGYSFGGYWTHTGTRGSYVDFVLQGTRYTSKVETATVGGFRPDGWGVSASIEGGRPFALGCGWMLEPQAQLIHQYLWFDDGQDRIARIHYESSTATYGRLGARLVRSWMVFGERRMTAWGRFNVWHDFEQRATTRISTLHGLQPVDLKTSLGGTWGQAQLAISGELSPTVSAFASGDYNFSLDDANAEGFGWRIGLRVRF